MIVIIDYGMGNLASVNNAFLKVGVSDVVITSEPDIIRKADKLVLPGVGAFGDAMVNLSKYSLIKPIQEFVSSGKPFMGICLGMHLLFNKGYENGTHEGLGLLKGEVVRFDIDLPVPHMGWNQARLMKNTGVFDNLPENAYFYYDHSYHSVPEERTSIAAITEYGIEFVSAVLKDNVTGIQFHPEKSHQNGLKIIENFGKQVRR